MTDDNPAIYSYTRAQAIADGVLVDVTGTAKEVGIIYPVALTQAVFDKYVRVPEGAEPGQSESGRLWDICWMFANFARSSRNATDSELLFELHVAIPDRGNWLPNEKPPQSGLTRESHRLVTLKAVCGPGDDPAPVITIMLPDED